MTVLKKGLRRVRDLLDADITHAQAGTDQTLPTENYTGLKAEVASTLDTTTSKVVENPMTINVTQLITTPEAVGENLGEWELRLNSNTESFNRTVTAQLAKTASQEVTRITTIEVTQD